MAASGEAGAAPEPELGPSKRAFRAWLDASDAERHSTRELEFDSYLDVRWRWPSEIHWTPIHVCRKAALLLSPQPGERVLDIGSGVGKFCIVGASVTEGDYLGVEVRQHLVEQARKVTSRLCVQGARFEVKNAFELDWGGFGALYLYNPFEEMKFPEECCIDDSQPTGVKVFDDSVQETVYRLEQLEPGTRVATYHGFGADFPPGWEQLFRGEAGSGTLEVWRRQRVSKMTAVIASAPAPTPAPSATENLALP
jgi:SAM-dependent methyltransferase